MKFDLRVSDERLKRQLDAFRHDVRARQKYARLLGGMVRNDAKKNLRSQTTVTGQPFEARRVKRSKKAVLKGLAKRLAVISKAADGGGAIVSWRNGLEAGIAGRHQWGTGEDWNPKRARQEYGSPDYKAPCTLAQARALTREGYRRPRKGKAPKRQSAKELQAAFTIAQAGVILRILRTGSAKGKQHWRDTVPERPFLGVTPDRAGEYCEELATRILNATKKGSA